MIIINCDLCGKVEDYLVKALIEGVELNVCETCSRFGKILWHLKKPDRIKPKQDLTQAPKEEKLEMLVENYAEIVRKKRESMCLSQKDFGTRINEKESIVHKIETGAIHPSFALAKKLEKVLGIRIIEEQKESHLASSAKKEEGFTLGDFIKVKKR